MIHMGRFQPLLAFGLLMAYVLGLLSGPRLLPAYYWPVTLMGQIRLVERVGPFLAC